MRKYMIEREIPDVGEFGEKEFCAAAQNSNQVLADLGPGIQWQHSYVTGNKTFCVYMAENEELIRRHAEISGFPANKITEIKRIIDPCTAEAKARMKA